MGFRIDNPLGEIKVLRFLILEQEVEILESLGQKEALHLIPRPWMRYTLDIVNGRVASRFHLGVLLKGLEDFPAILLILRVARELVQIVQRLNCLWPQQVMSVSVLDIHVLARALHRIKENDLGTQTCFHSRVHLIASFSQLLGQYHQIFSLPFILGILFQKLGPQRQIARIKANQMVHLGAE